ncbi:glycoside hydrolase superfamily [Bisporella sp. PMI_857]|nr:glycoside hydrolase superfamily [Bisporella sp. PMI_857]
MRIQASLLTSLLIPTALAQKIYQGFNSGSTLTDRTAKTESDFTSEFRTAQRLYSSPGTFNSARLYTNIQASTSNTPISAFPAAIATNTSLLLGIWCSGTDDISNEIEALRTAVGQHGDSLRSLVVGISVGSEDLYRVSESGVRNKAGLGKGADDIVEFIRQVRESLGGMGLGDVPVGHVDTWSAWSNSSNSAVIDACDFIGTDLYPYYEDDKDNEIANAKSIFTQTLNQTLTAAGDKPVWITETGWPVSGPNFGKAVASKENAQRYWSEVGCGLFGKTNTWWYNLRDSNPDNEAKFAITEDLSTTSTAFNLSCPAGSGAPASVNLDQSKDEEKKGDSASMSGLMTSAVLFGAVGFSMALGAFF